MIRRVIQNIIISTIRPYVSRELLGWGGILNLVGSYRQDWLWATAPVKPIRGKLHGYLMHLNLTEWPDRSTYFLGRWYDLETQLLMFNYIRSGDTVIDVGANRGMFALTASKLVAKNGRVICFEPNPNCLRVLRQEIETNDLKNIIIHPCALGNREDELILSVPIYNSGQGTLSDTLYDKTISYQIQSQIKIGDEILKGEQPSFIKIDVEGFESNVIKGLAKTIRQHRPIIVTEICPAFLVSCGSSFKELATVMSDLDYRGYKLVLRKTRGQYDLHFDSLDDDGKNCDAVWLHLSAVGTHTKVLHNWIA